MVWKNWIDNLLEKVDDYLSEQILWEISLNNQVHKLCVKFGEIIGFKNIVEKWVDNLAEKNKGKSWVEKWSFEKLTVYGVQ